VTRRRTPNAELQTPIFKRQKAASFGCWAHWAFRIWCLTFGVFLFTGCDNDPHPAPYHKTRPDGSPWAVRYMGLPADPKSFDPQFAYTTIDQQFLEPVYDKLLEYNPMKQEQIELQPAMLEAMPTKEVHPDGRVSYLCRLKRNIRFHDDPCFEKTGGKGREVVAADVHYVLQRLADPKVESPFFAPLEQRIIGLHEAREQGLAKTGKFDYATPVSGFEAIDSHTFRIHLKGPYPQLLYWMAMNTLSPVARESVEYYDGQMHDGKLRPRFRFYTVGHGPFRMREYIPRRAVRYERFDGYHTSTFPTEGFPPERAEVCKKYAGKPLPLFDELYVMIVPELIPGFVLGRQGYLDSITANKDAFPSVVGPDHQLRPKYKARGMSLEEIGLPGTFFYSFNMEEPLLGKNIKLRKALAAACDMRAYVEIFYSGVAPVSNQLIPRGLYGYDPNYVDPNAFDLEKAKRLLAEAGYPGGRDAKTGEQLELTLDDPVEGTEMRQRAEYEKRMFEELGIKIKIRENTFARVVEQLEQGNYQFSSGSGWAMDYPDPENFFMLFYSKNMPREGANYCRYNNPEFDRAFEQMSTMDNGPERLALIQKMNAMLAEDCPVIWQFDKVTFLAPQPWAHWTHNSRTIEYSFNKYHQVDPVLREKLRAEWNRKPMWPLFVLGGLIVAGLGYAVHWNRREHV
jgi:ABC-type transport system substrate-binding protein